MKLTDYLIKEAFSKSDWKEAARIVWGDPHSDIEDCHVRVYRHPDNIPEVIVDRGDVRRRWSSLKPGVTTEENFCISAPSMIIIFRS